MLVLTQAMNLPALQMSPYSAQLGIVSFLFALSAINDLIPLLEKNTRHFQSVVPFRLMIFFIVTGLSFLLQDNLYLHNNAVFVYGFCEVWMNFLIFVALRDERNDDTAATNGFFSSPTEEELNDPFPSSERELQEMENDEEEEEEE